jgi:hypothetical protein
MVCGQCPPYVILTKRLTDYVGTYYSVELGSSYKITLDENILAVKCKGNSPFNLKSIGQDLFFAESDRFQFIRDEQKRAIGFDRCGTRVRQLHFSKQ